jgi:hypothetical protein
MKSKTALFAALAEITGDATFVTEGLRHHRVSDETFGRKSFIYLFAKKDTRKQLYRELVNRGFKATLTDHRDDSPIDVQVSYFKGWHWDE